MASAVLLNSSPIVLGNDGNWITYSIQIGTPPQTFNVIPSTVLSDTWVINPSVCSQASGNAQANCAAARGSLFDPRSSSTWEYIFDNSNTAFSLGIEAGYGWNQSNTGSFGHDTLVLQSEKGAVPVLGTVIGSMSTNATATGLLGLASKQVSFQNGAQTSATNSTLQILRDAGTIPSMSFSYSAGAFYNKTTGLLILGGYDSASYVPNNVPFTFASDPNNVLSVGLLSITSTTNGDKTTLSDGAVQALIDSTVSELWLPESWCDKFASVFNLTYNPTNQLYILDSNAIALNNKNNPVVTIEIANTQVANNGNTVSIQFPWNAFNNTYTDINVPGYTRSYFSIRRTTGQYTLGRAFLQEAVITVDHERRNFSVSQVLNLANTTPNVVNIPSLSSTSTGGGSSGGTGSATATPEPSSGGSGISGGAIGGIVVAVIVLAVAAIAGFWFWRRRRNQYSSPENAKIEGPPRLPPEAFNEKSGAAEMATPPPGNSTDPLFDYHVSQRQNIKAAMVMSHSRSELDGDTFSGERAQSPLPAYVPNVASRAHPNQPAELPSDRAASELHSGPASPTSSPPFSPPVSEMVPSPGSEGQLASAADMGWGTSPTEAQSNHPAGYMTARGANPRDLRASPGVNSNRGSDVLAMGATSGPLDVGLGIHDRGVSESLQRQDSTRTKNSTTDLVSPLGSISGPPPSVSNALSSNIPRKPARE